MHFDIKDLKLFLAISEEGSLTRGAEKLTCLPHLVACVYVILNRVSI